MILRCTAKVLALIREPTRPPEVPPDTSDWYVNVFPVERRKCLLLTHASTLFSVFVPGVTVADLRPPGPLVVSRIHASLRAEDLSVDSLGVLDPTDVVVAKTADRRVLGVMNDHRFLIEHILAQDNGLACCDVGALNHRLHRQVTISLGAVHPIDLVRRQSVP